MTSNAGSDRSEGTVGFGLTVNEQGKAKAIKALEEFLRPEFINRVDDVICFNRLTEENFKSIAAIMLRELSDALKERGVSFNYTPDVLDYLTEKGYSVKFGARNLRRLIQRDIEDAVANRMIDSYREPVTVVAVSREGDALKIDAR